MILEKDKLSILFLSQSNNDVTTVRCQLEKEFAYLVSIEVVADLQEFTAKIRSIQYDTILCSLAGNAAKVALKQVRSICPDVPFICIAESNTEGEELELLEQGAMDIIFKNRLGMLSFSIKRSLKYANEHAERRRIESFYLEAQSIAHLGNWDWDLVHDATYWSDEMFRLLGYNPKACNPSINLYLKLMQVEDRDAFFKAIQTALNGKESFAIEHEIICQDQSKKIVLTQGYAVYDNNDIPIRIISTTQDITERKKIEKQIVKVKDDLEEAQQIAHIGSWSRNIKSNELYWSDELYRIFGLVPRNYKPTFSSFIEFIHPDDRKHEEECVNNSIKLKVPLRVEYRIIRGLEIRYILENGKVYCDSEGKPMQISGTVLDITELKKAEEESKKHTEIQTRSKLMTEFFTNVSHEFKTPLSIILMQLELMKMYLDDEKKMQELIKAATQNSYRLTRLVGNILDISRLDAGFAEAKLVQADIIALIRDIYDTVDLYSKAKSIQFSFVTSLIKKNMPTDVEKLERILLNLLSNAIKNTAKGGKIIVSVNERKAGGLLISVEDNGVGIPIEKQQIIFERFSQVDTATTRENEGCGIGLALVKSLVEVLKGSISVKSELGKGSIFTVELPLLDIDPETKVIDLRPFNLKKKAEMELSDIY